MSRFHIEYLNRCQRDAGIPIRKDADIGQVIRSKGPGLKSLAEMWDTVIIKLALRFAAGSDTPVEAELYGAIERRMEDIRTIPTVFVPYRTACDASVPVGSLFMYTQMLSHKSILASEEPPPEPEYSALRDWAVSLVSLLEHVEESQRGDAGPLRFCPACGRWFERSVNVPHQQTCSRKCSNRYYYENTTKRRRIAARRKAKKKAKKKSRTNAGRS